MHGPPDPDANREKAASKARYRRLIGGGGAVLDGVRIADINGLVELLIEKVDGESWLKVEASEDKQAIASALGRMLDDLIASRRS